MREFSFFSKLSPVTQEKLLRNSTYIKVPVDTQLYAQGDICVDILFLTKGRVRVSRQNENGQSVLLFYFEQGEQCNVNFTSSYNSAPAVGTAIAETDLEGYDIPASLIAELFVEDKEFQRYVFDQYVNRMEKMASLIEEVRFMSLDKRLMQWIDSHEDKKISITHEEIADIIGTSREVISRLLKGFEKEGMIKLSRRKIEVIQRSSLPL